jgi:chromosome partitioning protein
MKTIAYICQKGGSGKTTAAIHTAVAAHLAGQAVAVVDLDPQASAYKWHRRRKSDPDVALTQAEGVSDLLERAQQQGGDIVILDTPPNADRDARVVARAADLIIIPSRISIVDFEAVAATWEMTHDVRRPAYVMFNAVLAQSPQSLVEAKEYMAKRRIPVCPIAITQRKVFSDSLMVGQSAQEVEPASKSASEMASLLSWIQAELGRQ